MKRLIIFMLALMAGSALAESDRIYLEETVVSGNEELPRVLYVQPWRSMRQELPALTLPDAREELLQPLHPTTFRRLLELESAVRQINHPSELEN